MEEKIKTEVNGKEAGEATVQDMATTEKAETPKKEGVFHKVFGACWRNRGKIGVAVGSGLTFIAMCLLNKDGGDDSNDEGPADE